MRERKERRKDWRKGKGREEEEREGGRKRLYVTDNTFPFWCLPGSSS